ncbi:MAG: hypothetical protein U0521_25255 [Anaerolineae bacterium]
MAVFYEEDFKGTILTPEMGIPVDQPHWLVSLGEVGILALHELPSIEAATLFIR